MADIAFLDMIKNHIPLSNSEIIMTKYEASFILVRENLTKVIGNFCLVSQEFNSFGILEKQTSRNTRNFLARLPRMMTSRI